MLEKGLKFVLPVIIGLMAFAMSYVLYVEKFQLNAVFSLSFSLVIAITAGVIYSFYLFMFPSFLLIVWKKVSWSINRLLHQAQVKSEEATLNEDNESTSISCQISEVTDVTENFTKTWAKTKEELLAYTQQSVFPYFPEQYHPALLQIVEDFASNNIACSSPIKCTLKETAGLKSRDICHFIGNLYLKFMQVDKNKVMKRNNTYQFVKNAFPNIITQEESFIKTHLVEYKEHSIIRTFPKNKL